MPVLASPCVANEVSAQRLPPYVLAPAFESLEAGLDEGRRRLGLQKLEALQGHAQKSETNGRRDEHNERLGISSRQKQSESQPNSKRAQPNSVQNTHTTDTPLCGPGDASQRTVASQRRAASSSLAPDRLGHGTLLASQSHHGGPSRSHGEQPAAATPPAGKSKRFKCQYASWRMLLLAPT